MLLDAYQMFDIQFKFNYSLSVTHIHEYASKTRFQLNDLSNFGFMNRSRAAITGF